MEYCLKFVFYFVAHARIFYHPKKVGALSRICMKFHHS